MPNLALVGAAHIHTPAYIDVLNRHEKSRVEAVWDHNHSRAQDAAKRLEAVVAPNLDEIWDNDDAGSSPSWTHSRNQITTGIGFTCRNSLNDAPIAIVICPLEWHNGRVICAHVCPQLGLAESLRENGSPDGT